MTSITHRLAALLLLTIFFLTGCLETDDTLVLNPDGSGKIKREMFFDPVQMTFSGEEHPDKDVQLRDAVRQELRNARGIEAWADIEYDWTDDERVRLQFTGYFRDYNEVQFHNAGMDDPLFDLRFTREDDRIRLSMTPDSSSQGSGVFADKDQPPVTPENVDERVRSERAEFRRARPFLTALLNDLRSTVRVRMPGRIIEASGFEENEREVMISVSGREFFERVDAIMADEDSLREALLMDEAESEALTTRMMTGEDGPFYALFATGEDQFDYEEEVTAARESSAPVLAELRVTPVEYQPGAADAFSELDNIVVGGIRSISAKTGSMRGLRAFNHPPGLTISVFAELPQAVTEVSAIEIHEAMTLDGADLLPRERHQRRPFGRLSEDRHALQFDAQLRVPDEPTEALQKLSGTLKLKTSLGTEEDDLGFERFAIGEAGTEFNARIAEEDFGWGDEEQFVLRMNIDASEFAEIRFFDGAGNEFEVNQRGHMMGGGQVELTFSHTEPLPEDGRVVLVRHAGFLEFEVPFELNDISLLPGTQ